MPARVSGTGRIGALHGDRFIVRDSEARHTLGGGQVLDPDGPARRRKTPRRLAELAALQITDPAHRLDGLLELNPDGLDLDSLAVNWNRESLANEVPADSLLVHASHENWIFSGPHWRSQQDTLLAGLAGFHEHFPDELGPDAARARRMFMPRLPAVAFAVLVQALLADGTLQRSGSLHLPTHRITLNPQEEASYQRIRPWLADATASPWVRDLARLSGQDEGSMRRLLQKLARQGKLYQVVRDLFYAPETVMRLATVVHELENAVGEAGAADFRDRTGLSRKRAIQVLEFFDRVGFTRRVREAHRLRNPDMFGEDEHVV